MKKCMISQPMRGKTEEEIKATRDKWLAWCKENDYEPVNTLFTDEWYSDKSMKERGVKNIPLCFLAKSLDAMTMCDAVYFVKGWEETRECVIEHQVAMRYGVAIMFYVVYS